MSAPLIFVGDIHLGRRPAGLDDALATLGLDARRLSPAEAWRRTVAHALRVRARAVVLAGDVVDDAKDRFEAYRSLQEGARTLTGAGVPLYVVAGNHDSLVLPRLAAQVDGVVLIGAGGRWQRVEVPGDGPEVDLLGWSFPQPVVRHDPTAQPDLGAALGTARPEARVLGVVHGDLGASTSRYAPIAPANLRHERVAGWFLGHVHAPHPLAAMARPVGYLGSLVGLDPGEPGARGPWEVRVDGGVSCVHVPLGPVRWDTVQVPLQHDVADVDAVVDAIRDAAARHVAALDAAEALDLVALRVHLTGRLRLRSAAQRTAGLPAVDLAFRAHGTPVIVETVVDRTQPAVDLDALAADPSPAGFVARRLLGLLAAPPDEAAARWARARVDAHHTGRWRLDPDAEPPDAVALALAACWEALTVLVDQRAEVGS